MLTHASASSQGVDCDGWAGVLKHRLQGRYAVQCDVFDAHRSQHVLACGGAEHLSMTGLRLDSMSGFELQHHGQAGLKVAGMRDPAEQPLECAVADSSGSQHAAHLTSDKEACLIWVHGGHAEMSRS